MDKVETPAPLFFYFNGPVTRCYCFLEAGSYSTMGPFALVGGIAIYLELFLQNTEYQDLQVFLSAIIPFQDNRHFGFPVLFPSFYPRKNVFDRWGNRLFGFLGFLGQWDKRQLRGPDPHYRSACHKGAGR